MREERKSTTRREDAYYRRTAADLGSGKERISKKMERQCEIGHGVDWTERVCAQLEKVVTNGKSGDEWKKW